MPISRRMSFAPLLLTLAIPAYSARGETPLYLRIDELVGAGKADFESVASPLASDAEFLRRVTLDLNGIIPSAAEAREFLDDPDSSKRRRRVDQLLASPRFARHFAAVLDKMLMERRADTLCSTTEWRQFLRGAIAAGKPWDQIVREILVADGSDPRSRGVAKFYLDRAGEPHAITRDIGRMFLGVDLQCAQCHDHPLVSSYFQEHYYGLFSFVNQVSLYPPLDPKAALGEKVDRTPVSFTSVFTKEKGATGPKLPGLEPLAEPATAAGAEYLVAPTKNGVRPIPRHSRRELLAAALTAAENRAFARNMANRLWAMLLGRGLVEPVDMHHADNPPSHPALLDLLTDELIALRFDLAGLIRQIVLSTTYQRSSEAPEGASEPLATALGTARLRPLEAEPLAWSVLRATGRIDTELAAEAARLKTVDPKFGAAVCRSDAWRDRFLDAKFTGDVGPFDSIFSGARGQPEGPFAATVEQALFVRNGAVVRGWIARQPSNLVDRLAVLPTRDLVAEELYLSVLTRRPSPAERAELATRLDRTAPASPEYVSELEKSVWALVASTEFRFNH